MHSKVGPFALALILAFTNVPVVADPVAAPTDSPPPGITASINIDEKVADNQKFIDESGADATAALKLGNDADDAAKAAQALNAQSLDGLKTAIGATEIAVKDIESAPVQLIAIDDAPRQELWTAIDRDTAAAKAALAKAGQTVADPNASECEKLHDALQQLDLSNDAIAAVAATPADVLDYIKHLFARAQGAGASAALVDQVQSELDPELFSMSAAVSGAAAANRLIVDDAYVIKDQESKANCGEIAGQFQATMNATFLTKANTEWWKYETDLGGTIHLRYTFPDKPGQTETVVGDVSGAATKFTVWTDPFNSPPGQKFIGGSLVSKNETPPDAEPELALQSAGALLGEPATFDMPVSGTITGDTLKLTLGDADKDFDPGAIQSQTTFEIASPYTMYHPVKTSYKLPYKDAHWIVQKFFPVTWTISAQGPTDSTSVFGTKDLPGTQNDAKYDFTAKLCEPGCV